MYPFRYSVAVNEGFDNILIEGNPITITVYPLAKCRFRKKPTEAQWFCDHSGELYIFETNGYSPIADPLHLLSLDSAIRWYAAQVLDNPEMSIFKTGPVYPAHRHCLN